MQHCFCRSLPKKSFATDFSVTNFSCSIPPVYNVSGNCTERASLLLCTKCKEDQDACFISTVISQRKKKLFAPLFAGRGQEKHTTAGSRKSGGRCSSLTKQYPHMVYILGGIFVYFQDQANSSQQSPKHIHNVCSS